MCSALHRVCKPEGVPIFQWFAEQNIVEARTPSVRSQPSCANPSFEASPVAARLERRCVNVVDAHCGQPMASATPWESSILRPPVYGPQSSTRMVAHP